MKDITREGKCFTNEAHNNLYIIANPLRIAAIDFQPPFILSGSSDKHIRLFDFNTQLGWSTSPDFHNPVPSTESGITCGACGSNLPEVTEGPPSTRSSRTGYKPTVIHNSHNDLVRSVAFGHDLVVSGSYDQSIKV